MNDKELLNRIYANQVIIYRHLLELEAKVNGGARSMPDSSAARQLDRLADKLLQSGHPVKG